MFLEKGLDDSKDLTGAALTARQGVPKCFHQARNWHTPSPAHKNDKLRLQ